jgi:choline-glycine betaine transporter
MSQQQLVRSIWLSIIMMVMSTLMLIGAILSFTAHAPVIGETFLAVMIIFGAAGFASSMISSNRARAFAQARQHEERDAADSAFRESLP